MVPYGLPFAWPCSPVMLLWTNKGCQYTITVFVQTKFYLWCVVWTASLCPCSSDLGCCLLRRCTCFASKNRVNTATYSSAISCLCCGAYGLQAQYPPLCLSLAVLDVAVVVGPIREASPRVLVDETGAPDSVTALLRKKCCCLCTLCSCCPLAADAWLFRAGFVAYNFSVVTLRLVV